MCRVRGNRQAHLGGWRSPCLQMCEDAKIGADGSQMAFLSQKFDWLVCIVCVYREPGSSVGMHVERNAGER